MSAKFPKGRKTPENPVAPAATALPVPGVQAPAKTLSGAFAAALGGKPQIPHSGSKTPDGARSIPKRLAEDTGMHPVRKANHGASAVPRKGHR